ncbi:protein RALF-like 22 [Malania oleifera]|uniref:protein RALF-like 22 n=1 Tax=Malania oleifera TaxID=397392 RepID=UPI0025AE89B1|nr:protein RALF-like 22 [Malania oleifera]
MALRVWPVLLLLALTFALVAKSTASFDDVKWSFPHISNSGGCNGLVGDCIGTEDEMMMSSEASRRGLAQARRYISYGALKKNNVPCSRRGQSYYNCNGSGKANPYKRGCSSITRCARTTN